MLDNRMDMFSSSLKIIVLSIKLKLPHLLLSSTKSPFVIKVKEHGLYLYFQILPQASSGPPLQLKEWKHIMSSQKSVQLFFKIIKSQTDPILP